MMGLRIPVTQYCLGLFFIVAVLTGCNTLDVYEKTTAFATHSWSSNDSAKFNFIIKDTSAPYNLMMVLRHEDLYGYKNIWLSIKVIGPDSSFTIKREFTLADNSKWFGSSIDDIVEHRIKFNTQPIPLKKGNYSFVIRQEMREDPLLHVLNAGIRIEKFKQ